MRSWLTFVTIVVAAFCPTCRGEEASALKGLDGVQFSSSVMTMAEIVLSKDRLARTAEDALDKAGLLRKGNEAAAYPLLTLTVHGGIKGDVVFFVWELQVKEKAELPANKTYRRAAYRGPVIIWQSTGMMTTNPARMELDLMKQIEKAIGAFIKKWREANAVETAGAKFRGKF